MAAKFWRAAVPAAAKNSPPDPAGGYAAPFQTIKRRQDFLAVARARKASAPGLILQARKRVSDAKTIRVGYTCSKKVGGAVARNRAKRRLRAAAQHILPIEGRPGWDYVLIGLSGRTIARPFDALMADLSGALARIHEQA